MTLHGARLDAVRDAHDQVAGWLLDMRALVGREFRQPLAGATAETAREAGEELHRLGCLSLALDPLDDPTGPHDARLLADPIEVTFTLATGEPAHVERLTLAEAVAAAHRHRAAICRLVDAYRAAVQVVTADLDRLRRDVGAAGDAPGAHAGHPEVPDDLAERLAALQRQAAVDPVGCGRPGPWRDAVAVLARQRSCAGPPTGGQRSGPPSPSGPDHRTSAAARRLRASADRLRRLATEAAGEGLGGGDPPVGLDTADDLLARAAAGHDPDGDLVDALDRAADRVDAARRHLRGRCHRELRGRLEAYRQRAADEGRAEHPDLDRHYRKARDALRAEDFTVRGASRAVRAYQQAVNEVIR